jgi:hypothetical protein
MANSTLVDRVDLATLAIAALSRPATRLSVLAPAQRAGAQRLRAMDEQRKRTAVSKYFR